MAFGAPVRLKSLAINAAAQGTLGGSGQKIIAAAAVGDLVVVAVGFGLTSTPTITVTDSKSNTWTLADRGDMTTSNTPHSAIYYSVLTTALVSGTDYITVTFGTNVNFPVGLFYKTAPAAGKTVSLDVVDHSKGTSSAPTGSAVTTTGSDEILFGTFCSGPATALTAGTGWTLTDLDATSTNKRLDLEYRIESSTGTFTANGTYGSSPDYAAVTAAFKATSSGTTVTVPGPASATGAGGTSPAEADVQATAASAPTAAALAAAPALSATSPVAAATATAGVPSFTISGGGAISVTAVPATATATTLLRVGPGFGEGGFGESGFGGSGLGSYGDSAYGDGVYGGQTYPPIPLIEMLPAAVAATAAGLTPSFGASQGEAAVTATVTATALPPTVTFGGSVSAGVATATGSSLTGVPTSNISAVVSAATAAALASTFTSDLPLAAPAATASAVAPIPAVVVTAAPIVVTATTAATTAAALTPAPQSGVAATAAQGFAIAFGGVLTAPVILVELPVVDAQALAQAPAPTFTASSILRASSADATAVAFPTSFDLDFLTGTPIVDLDFTDTEEDDEPWLTTTVKGTLTLV